MDSSLLTFGMKIPYFSLAYSMDRIEHTGHTIDVFAACNRLNMPLVRWYSAIATVGFILFLHYLVSTCSAL